MTVRCLLAAALVCVLPLAHARMCEDTGVQLQVLGSGGPELKGGRAASGYVIWIDGRSRVLVDVGGGTALRFGQANATVTDLDAILLTHLHADHTADLVALVKASSYEERRRSLPLYGPVGSRDMPSTVTFVRALFDSTRGAYRYLGDFLSPLRRDTYKLQPHDVRRAPNRIGPAREHDRDILPVFANERVRISATAVPHGTVPALAYRVEASGKAIVFSGDTSGESEALARLARSADLLLAHHAVTEAASEEERRRHMTPAVIGRLAQAATARQVVLAHRTSRTLGKEEETLQTIGLHYQGPVVFAEDLGCYNP